MLVTGSGAHTLVFALALAGACGPHAAHGGGQDNIFVNMFTRVLSGSQLAAHNHVGERVKVIGAGYGRTGTASLQAALNILGFKTYHMQEVAANGHAPTWQRWLETGDFTPVARALEAGGYNATTDDPASIAYRELLELSPESKVVLTHRDNDVERWMDSISLMSDLVHASKSFPLNTFAPLANMNSMYDKFWESRRNCTIPVTAASRPWCLKNYHDHVEEVKRAVPKERLLVFQVTEGWGPLCAFLGVPIPDVPFPRINSSSDIKVGFALVRIVQAGWFLILASPLLAVWKIWKRCAPSRDKLHDAAAEKARKTK